MNVRMQILCIFSFLFVRYNLGYHLGKLKAKLQKQRKIDSSAMEVSKGIIKNFKTDISDMLMRRFSILNSKAQKFTADLDTDLVVTPKFFYKKNSLDYFD